MVGACLLDAAQWRFRGRQVVNKNLREQAATLCSAYASECIANQWVAGQEIVDALGTSRQARVIAQRAYDRVPMGTWSEAWAEACSLLRSGEFEGGKS